LKPLVEETGLVGLNSIDLMVDDDGEFHLLEVNPRPGASLDIFDGEGSQALFGRHVAACEGRFSPGWHKPFQASAMSVVYAESLIQVPGDISYPAWLADRPAPGARIEPGEPVCTVMAQAADAPSARAGCAGAEPPGSEAPRRRRRQPADNGSIGRRKRDDTMARPSVNLLTVPLVEGLVRDAQALRITVERSAGGRCIIDAGIDCPGGIEAGGESPRSAWAVSVR
jgi:hypothetical protein